MALSLLDSLVTFCQSTSTVTVKSRRVLIVMIHVYRLYLFFAGRAPYTVIKHYPVDTLHRLVRHDLGAGQLIRYHLAVVHFHGVLLHGVAVGRVALLVVLLEVVL
jgi:hypothetical protein